FALVCTGCIGIIAGDVLVGVSQIRLHIRAAAIAFTCRLRCGREEKRREEKRREEKRREEKRREEKRREEKRREEKRREEKRREGFLRAGFIFGSLFGLTG
ncbi:hypothetical protein U9V72_001742, partial [Neisseria gonorrhoeae]